MEYINKIFYKKTNSKQRFFLMKEYKSILITGATSGIGRALAIYYADNDINLALTGRNKNRLDDISKICEEKGAKVISKIIDVKHQNEMEEWIKEIDGKIKLDLVIANAGISSGTGDNISSESIDQIKDIFDTNLYGVINTISPIIPIMKNSECGQIAIISSLASFRGFPSAPAYCSSKAAVRIYGESLRAQLKTYNIGVSVICPGFIKSGITNKNKFRMPLLMDADKAAKIISTGLSKNKGRISFPFPMFFLAWILSVFPDFISSYITSKSPSK